MILPIVAIIIGFVLLIKSADKFVEGASSVAHHSGMPPLLIGMLIVGFGTSAPEMVVSAMAAMDGNPALALGNAIGSNIVNISLILGVTAVLAPIAVHSNIVRKELPILVFISLALGVMLWDFEISTLEAYALLGIFFGVFGWQIYAGLTGKGDTLEADCEADIGSAATSLSKSILMLTLGLIVLVASSRLLVWGAVEIAAALGVSDLIIGLTIVALGTSLPELAASITAVRKGEHDLAIGNVVGSNMFNTLAVIGIAGAIQPISNIGAEVFWRDWLAMIVLTVLLLLMSIKIGKSRTINRYEGGALLLTYVGYNAYLISSSF
ncbi:calcium/sodium antiporter [Marinomonas ostreistagni]|uniref:Calcium/sodium antiporter n=1 Tax=Marinomonas ostreistagni TaxID=359209 RepID=A0ABS0ZDW3_9GAMM|nr:calcium/sodium antiporter [Marinomonas ostreistagni]MBJ7551869.1 calcium/sodium antiporter [Marinomonas ostreistagni]